MVQRFLRTRYGMLGMLAAAVPATQAAAAATPGVHYKNVCGISRSNTYAECFALVRTDAKGHTRWSAPP